MNFSLENNWLLFHSTEKKYGNGHEKKCRCSTRTYSALLEQTQRETAEVGISLCIVN